MSYSLRCAESGACESGRLYTWCMLLQALKVAGSFPGLLEGLQRSEDQHRALIALGRCCKQLPTQIQPGSAAQQADSSVKQLSLT